MINKKLQMNSRTNFSILLNSDNTSLTSVLSGCSHILVNDSLLYVVVY